MRDSDVAIVGVGVTAQGRVPNVSAQDLQVGGLRLAIADAGLSPADIDGYIYQPGIVDMLKWGTAGRVPKRLGIDANIVWEIQAGGTSAISAIASAHGLIASGAASYVAIGYGDTALSGARLVGAGSAAEVPRNTMAAYGMFSPGADHALAAQRHMHLYGTTKEQLGSVALSAREFASKRPEAYMHGRPLTMHDYLGARPIADPLNKYDYCLVADGGCALIVTSIERARDLPRRSILVSGLGFSHSIGEGYDRLQYSRSGLTRAAAQALANAGIALDAVDVAQIYDCFTIEVLMALEAIGFCEPGEGGPYIADGNLALDARVPVNTAGGELAWSYMQGFTPVVEAIRQLRGEGADTQVPDAETCLVTGHGGTAVGNGQMEYADACMIMQVA